MRCSLQPPVLPSGVGIADWQQGMTMALCNHRSKQHPQNTF
jgi:hypothetical protein